MRRPLCKTRCPSRPQRRSRTLVAHSYCTSPKQTPRLSSHSPAALIEFVALDNRFDVSTRCGEIDLLQKLPFRYLSNAVSTGPTSGTRGAGVVFRQGERSWIALMVPMFHGSMQIPGARLEIGLWFEKLIRIETADLIFAHPLVSRYFGHLHQAALSMSTALG